MSAKFWMVLGLVAVAVVLPSYLARAEVGGDETLIALAYEAMGHGKLPWLSSYDEKVAFKKFFRAIQDGQTADFTPKKAEEEFWNPISPGFGLFAELHLVYAESWGTERTVKAEWIEWLCTTPKAVTKVRSHGIEIVGARIEGEVNLERVNLPFPLRTFRCAFTNDINLNGAKLASLQFQSTHIKSLKADALTVDGDINFTDGFRAEGEVWLRNATINGPLNCDNSQFIAPPPTQADNPELAHPALNLEGAKTDVVLLRNVVAHGEVRMRDATISGKLNCNGGYFIASGADWPALDLQGAKTGFVTLSGSSVQGKLWLYRVTIDGNLECDREAKFINPSGYALNFDYAKTGSVLLQTLHAKGTVSLLKAILDGSLECDDARFSHPEVDANEVPKEVAIRAHESFIKGNVRLVNVDVDGYLDFGGSQIDHDLLLENVKWGDTTLLDLSFAKAQALLNSEPWPKHGALNLKGFTFEQLRSGKDDQLHASAQNDWIKRQSTKFNPQSYEQMAAVFRRMGLQEEAVEVMIKKNEAADQAAIEEDWSEFSKNWWNPFLLLKTLWDCCWHCFLGWGIGYGYHAGYALFLSLFVIAIGMLFFQKGYDAGIVVPTSDGVSERRLSESYPKFNAFIYSLETFVPLVKLGVGDHWRPNAHGGAELCRSRFSAFKILPFKTVGGLLRVYFCLHIIAGWVLTTLWVGAFTGIIKT